MISAQQAAGAVALIKLPLERPVFLREYKNGTYSYGAYFVTSLVAEWPIVLAQNALNGSLVHHLIGFDGSLAFFVLLTFLLHNAICAIAAMISAGMNSVEGAAALMPVVLVPQMLFVGLFVRIEQIPVWVRWARHLCVLKYAMAAEVLNEFACGDSYACRDWLETNDYHQLSMWENLGAVACFVAGAQVLGALLLKRSIG
jgi:ABC-type multidrug transport system permease subunit